MNPYEKIDIWMKTAIEMSKIKRLNKRLKDKIPLTIRKDIYIQTVVKGHKQYQKRLFEWCKVHNIN